MWTYRIVLALGTAVVASVALWASAAPALEKPRTFSLLEVDRTFLPLSDFTSDRAPVGGDRFAEMNELYRWTGPRSKGRKVGRNQVLVTFLTGFGAKFTHRATLLIAAQVYLPDGTLMVEGFGTIAPNRPARLKLPVVGGTGVYEGAGGHVTVREVGNTGRTKLDFHLVP